MPAKTYWIEEPHIMCAHYSGKVSVEDVDLVVAGCLPELEARPMVFLLQARDAMFFDINVLRHGGLLKLVRHRNTICFAIVGLNRMVQAGLQLLHVRSVKPFDDTDDAVAYLREQVSLHYEKQAQPTE